jgi:hypothetical protein
VNTLCETRGHQSFHDIYSSDDKRNPSWAASPIGRKKPRLSWLHPSDPIASASHSYKLQEYQKSHLITQRGLSTKACWRYSGGPKLMYQCGESLDLTLHADATPAYSSALTNQLETDLPSYQGRTETVAISLGIPALSSGEDQGRDLPMKLSVKWLAALNDGSSPLQISSCNSSCSKVVRSFRPFGSTLLIAGVAVARR